MGKSESIANNFTYIFIDQDEKSFNYRENQKLWNRKTSLRHN